jgi:hypothetical protein
MHTKARKSRWVPIYLTYRYFEGGTTWLPWVWIVSPWSPGEEPDGQRVQRVEVDLPDDIVLHETVSGGARGAYDNGQTVGIRCAGGRVYLLDSQGQRCYLRVRRRSRQWHIMDDLGRTP